MEVLKVAKKINIVKVGVGSLGRLIGTVNAIVALAIGIIASIATTANVLSNNEYSILTDVLVAIGIVLVGVIVYPLIGFIFGWLYGALVAVIWNVVLGVSEGLQITTEEVKEDKNNK